MTSTNNNNKQNIYRKSWNMDVIHRFIRITQLMNTRKYSQRRNTFVLTGPTNQLLIL